MKRLFTLLLCLAMMLSLIPAAAAEDIEIVETDPVGVGALDDPSDEELIEIVAAEMVPNAKPTVTAQPESVTAYAGTTAQFTVTAAGADSYQWYYRTSSTGSWAKSTAASAKTSTLSIAAETKRNGYQYRCKLSNSAGHVYSDAATLTVSAKPVITAQPTDQTAAAGMKVTFTVAADGAESWQWYYRKSAGGSWSKCSGGTGSSLTVEVKTYRDGYQYRCKLTNAKGRVYSSAATLTVSAKPVITTQPLDYTAGAGAYIYFKVKAAGAESYQWQYRSGSTGSWKPTTLTGNKTEKLTVKATAARDGYQYRCKVTNADGSTWSKAATLTVSGEQCGDKLTWKLSGSGLLTISGTGEMYDFETYSIWWDYAEQIKRVSIGSGVTSIGESAFYFCDSMTSVTIPAGVTSIGGSAFSFCNGLTTVTIPDSVTTIGVCAFDYCDGLTTVTIPAGVTSIGECAFRGGESMTKITVASGNQQYSSGDGVLFNKDKTLLIQYPGGKSGAYTIPDSVTDIGDEAFADSSGLTAVTIPAGVKSIGETALSGCTALTKITVASGNTQYSSKGGVLFNKDKTTLVQYPGGKAGAYTIPDSVTWIEDCAFDTCRGLTDVTIPDSVTHIGNFAFRSCSSLTSVTIPDSVTSLWSQLFAYCPKLTSVTIPASVTSIYWGAFMGCRSLSDVYYKGTKAQWDAISIDSSNTLLLAAEIHCEA